MHTIQSVYGKSSLGTNTKAIFVNKTATRQPQAAANQVAKEISKDKPQTSQTSIHEKYTPVQADQQRMMHSSLKASRIPAIPDDSMNKSKSKLEAGLVGSKSRPTNSTVQKKASAQVKSPNLRASQVKSQQSTRQYISTAVNDRSAQSAKDGEQIHAKHSLFIQNVNTGIKQKADSLSKIGDFKVKCLRLIQLKKQLVNYQMYKIKYVQHLCDIQVSLTRMKRWIK